MRSLQSSGTIDNCCNQAEAFSWTDKTDSGASCRAVLTSVGSGFPYLVGLISVQCSASLIFSDVLRDGSNLNVHDSCAILGC